MQRDQIDVGEKYATREPVARGVDLQQVRMLEHVRGTRWKAEWIDPNPGLVDDVTSKNIVCRIVLDSAGERPSDLWRGVLQVAEPEALERVAARAGITRDGVRGDLTDRGAR